MGSIYKEYGGYKTHVGHCEDGIIYSGNGNHNPIGRYDNGSIYNQFQKHVGSYGGGSIYNQFGEHIGFYESGIVYNKYSYVLSGKAQVGSYESNPAEAAALILLFMGEAAANGENSNIETSESSYSSSSSSDSGGSILGGILTLIGTIILLILKLIPYYFAYFTIPMMAGTTIYCLAGAGILGVALGYEPLAIALGVASMILFFSSIPYWIILFIQKHKQKLKWGRTFKYYGLWFIKGPFAYKDIIALKNQIKNND